MSIVLVWGLCTNVYGRDVTKPLPAKVSRSMLSRKYALAPTTKYQRHLLGTVKGIAAVKAAWEPTLMHMCRRAYIWYVGSTTVDMLI